MHTSALLSVFLFFKLFQGADGSQNVVYILFSTVGKKLITKEKQYMDQTVDDYSQLGFNMYPIIWLAFQFHYMSLSFVNISHVR